MHRNSSYVIKKKDFLPIRAFYFPLYSFKTYVIFRKGLRLVLSNIKDRKTNTQNASRDKSYEKKIQEVGEFFFFDKRKLRRTCDSMSEISERCTRRARHFTYSMWLRGERLGQKKEPTGRPISAYYKKDFSKVKADQYLLLS